MHSYAEIKIKLNEKEKTIIYYILEDEQYGIKISTKATNDSVEKDELVLHNIVKSKNDAEKIINSLIENNNDITQASYIIEDLLKKANNSKDEKLIS